MTRDAVGERRTSAADALRSLETNRQSPATASRPRRTPGRAPRPRNLRHESRGLGRSGGGTRVIGVGRKTEEFGHMIGMGIVTHVASKQSTWRAHVSCPQHTCGMLKERGGVMEGIERGEGEMGRGNAFVVVIVFPKIAADSLQKRKARVYVCVCAFPPSSRAVRDDLENWRGNEGLPDTENIGNTAKALRQKLVREHSIHYYHFPFSLFYFSLSFLI